RTRRLPAVVPALLLRAGLPRPLRELRQRCRGPAVRNPAVRNWAVRNRAGRGAVRGGRARAERALGTGYGAALRRRPRHGAVRRARLPRAVRARGPPARPTAPRVAAPSRWLAARGSPRRRTPR